MAAPGQTGGHARRLATGSLAQQASQVSGLLAMLAVITVLARELPLAEFGAYGLLASLAGYLLVVQNAAAGAAVRRIAGAADAAERDAVYSNALVLYLAAAVLAGVVVAATGLALVAGLGLPSDVASAARRGALLLGLATAVCWPLTIERDALRARQRFVALAAVEIAGVLAWSGLMVALGLSGASLTALVAVSGVMPGIVGVLAAAAGRADAGRPRLNAAAVRRDDWRELLGTAGWLSLAEAANPAVYAADRAVLGLVDGAGAVGLLEGPVRAANVVRALNAAVITTVLPAASRFVAEDDRRRLGELVLRGLRYSLALMVPVSVIGMVLSAPVLEAWLGPEFREGAPAMAILLALWLPYAASGVLIAVLVAAGEAARVARYLWLVALSSVVLAVLLIPPLELEGAALAAALPFTAVVPLFLRRAATVAGVGLGAVLREAAVPAYALGAVLAAGLGAARLALGIEGVAAVAACGLLGAAAYWVVFYAGVMRPGERELARSLISRS